MLVKTKAIVISALKFQEKSLIVKCFTESDGMKSYFVRDAFSSFSMKELYNINITFNNVLSAINYDVILLNIYNEDVGKLIYYGFNIGEKYDSTNIVGCLNLSKAKKVTLTIVIKQLDETSDEYLDIYMPNWNILMYKQGLAGIRYGM